MALGIVYESNGGGDITPIIKFDAKAGDFIRVDKHKDATGTWQKNEQEMATPFDAAFDMENIEVGWASFAGGRPDFKMVRHGDPMPEKPSVEGAEYKQAFRVKLANKDLGLREFSSQSKLVLKAFDRLHDQYVSERAAHPGKMPVVSITGTKVEIIAGQSGDLRFKVPEWSITAWADRPAIFDSASADSAPAPTPAAPVETGSDLF